MKTIVTHIGPDLDAIASVWLLQKYLPGFDEADIAFVPAGQTFDNLPPDENSDIIHVDTGRGKYDHHHLEARLSAAKQIYDDFVKQAFIPQADQEALERMIEFVTLIDNFQEVYFPNPTSDLYEFSLHMLLNGLKSVVHEDIKMVEATMPFLDAAFFNFKNKVLAEKEIKEGMTMKTKWGKTLFIETKNGNVTHLAQKSGFECVVRKDPEKGNISIKTLPDTKFDLTPLYTIILKKDKVGSWFLHSSKNMLLNGSSKNPTSVPSPLSLPQLIEIIKKM